MASTRDSIADIWGPRTPTLGSRWPVRVDRNVEEEPDRWVQGCCFLCSNGCGIDIAGTYGDVDVTDCFLFVGHDMAATATVLWARVLDRRRGDAPSRMIVIDPRRTATAAEADLHIKPRLGTNVAVLNGLIRELIAQGHADRAFIDAHTLGYDELARTVSGYTPERVAEIAHVPADLVREAAAMVGGSKMLLSTCLQGVYQSNQGTAAAVQVNNVNLVLGRIGRPGCGILQMNGQPTAENSRETGSGGDLSGFQAARALGDGELETSLRGIEGRNERQRNWLFSRIRQAAPQVLAVPRR